MKTPSFSPRGLLQAGSVTVAVDEHAQATLWLHGEHDVATVDTLADSVTSALAGSVGDVIIDLSDVGFMGAATIGALAQARARCVPEGRFLALRSPSERTRRLLGICSVGYEAADALSASGTASGLPQNKAVPRVSPSSSRPGSALLISSAVPAASSAP